MQKTASLSVYRLWLNHVVLGFILPRPLSCDCFQCTNLKTKTKHCHSEAVNTGLFLHMKILLYKITHKVPNVFKGVSVCTRMEVDCVQIGATCINVTGVILIWWIQAVFMWVGLMYFFKICGINSSNSGKSFILLTFNARLCFTFIYFLAVHSKDYLHHCPSYIRAPSTLV